jgi:predicted O-linked N-acetylglucosamine transferase (SPINDLY family)
LRWDLAFDSGTPGAAIDWLNLAIARSNVARNHYMLGCVLQAQGKVTAAADAFQAALELDPSSAKAHNNLGCVFEMMGNAQAAESHYQQAVTLDPGVAPALYNLGNLYRQSGKPELAISHMKRAMAIDASRPDWHCNLGELHHQRLELDEALVRFNAAIAIDSGYGRAHVALADAQLVCGRVTTALAALDRALEITSGRSDLASRSLVYRHFEQGRTPGQLSQRHLAWAKRHARGLARWSAAATFPRATGRQLNIGYVVPDFGQHHIVCHLAPLLESHDSGKFKVFGYSTIRRDDATSGGISGHLDHWRDISQLSDDDAMKRIRADGIDILVDLAGHGTGGRMLLFARKPAPIQVSWLGYPSTTGLPTMDYRLTDEIADPIGATEPWYVEKLVRLPGSHACYAPDQDLAAIEAASQRRTGEVVFGSICPLAAITDGIIAVWAGILGAIPNARLLLVAEGFRAQGVRDELGEKFQSLAVALARIEMRPPSEPRSRFYHDVDVVLDAVLFDAVTAACDALWMGVPVVTLIGSTYASRATASVLTAVGMTEFIATSDPQYIDIASGLASNIALRRTLRAALRARMRASCLMDTSSFVRGMEAAYLEMAEAIQSPAS